MNDYTARIIHEERTTQFRREAAASRLVSEARPGRPKRLLAAGIRSLGQAVARLTERRTVAAKVTPAAE